MPWSPWARSQRASPLLSPFPAAASPLCAAMITGEATAVKLTAWNSSSIHCRFLSGLLVKDRPSPRVAVNLLCGSHRCKSP
ncbi:hypothetical protein JCGZ_10303 [Jatropha curcas]|uniref:Uncharacterized protein n=1 Tax=Jatropha curcas TaxID=180498 RepID=A0A067KJH3_JATCU|nr:hypothetical protein JCGZ_10303 [Jatropha curcas]